jgi:hypothetical protein
MFLCEYIVQADQNKVEKKEEEIQNQDLAGQKEEIQTQKLAGQKEDIPNQVLAVQKEAIQTQKLARQFVEHFKFEHGAHIILEF